MYEDKFLLYSAEFIIYQDKLLFYCVEFITYKRGIPFCIVHSRRFRPRVRLHAPVHDFHF